MYPYGYLNGVCTKKSERKSFTSLQSWLLVSHESARIGRSTPIVSIFDRFGRVGNWLFLAGIVSFEFGDFGVGFPIKTTAYISVRCLF
jgi:hypothetical protein